MPSTSPSLPFGLDQYVLRGDEGEVAQALSRLNQQLAAAQAELAAEQKKTVALEAYIESLEDRALLETPPASGERGWADLD